MFSVVLVTVSLIINSCLCDVMHSDVSAWSTALQTNEQDVVREQLVTVQSIALNAIPKAKQLNADVFDFAFQIAYNVIGLKPANRTAASESITNFMDKQAEFLTDRSIEEGDKWFLDRSGNTPVDGYTRFFFDVSYFLFSQSRKDLNATLTSVGMLSDRINHSKLNDEELKMNTVVFFRALGQRDPADSLAKSANALNQFFMKWVSSSN